MMSSDEVMRQILAHVQDQPGEEKKSMPVMIKVRTTGQRTVRVNIEDVKVEEGKIILYTNPIG